MVGLEEEVEDYYLLMVAPPPTGVPLKSLQQRRFSHRLPPWQTVSLLLQLTTPHSHLRRRVHTHTIYALSANALTQDETVSALTFTLPPIGVSMGPLARLFFHKAHFLPCILCAAGLPKGAHRRHLRTVCIRVFFSCCFLSDGIGE